MLIRAELLALGIKCVDMIGILEREYGITVNKHNFSAMINGKINTDKAVKVRDACWDYINKCKNS